MAYQFGISSNITFGKDAAQQLPVLVDSIGAKKVMLVYDAGVKAAGIAEKVLAQLAKSGAEVLCYDKVLPNPTDELVEEAAKVAKDAGVDCFVAVGGGSAIDLTKAVNILQTNEGPINRYAGMDMVPNPTLPLIAIPTTAGTSSEITNVIALIDTVKVVKYVIIGRYVTADYAIIDPEFTKTMPKGVTAATGMDAITHAVESYISNMATPLTEYNALTGLKLLYDNLPKAVENGADMQARENMLLGCVITGFSFSNANLGLVHGIAHTLSAHFGLAHGMANAAVLPYVMAYNAETVPEKMVELAKAIGLTPSGNLDEDKYLLSKELLALTKKVGIKTLTEQGVPEDSFDMLADDVLREPVLGFNPRQNITKEDVIAILNQAK